jgi:hypothetical protein
MAPNSSQSDYPFEPPKTVGDIGYNILISITAVLVLAIAVIVTTRTTDFLFPQVKLTIEYNVENAADRIIESGRFSTPQGFGKFSMRFNHMIAIFDTDGKRIYGPVAEIPIARLRVR